MQNNPLPIPPAPRHTFPKKEHLRLRKQIDDLFGGSSSSRCAYPVRAVWNLTERPEGELPVLAMMSVAKRRLRLAVNRNRAKRQLREAYRLNKEIVTGRVPTGKQLHLAFLWLSEKPVDSDTIASRVRQLLQTIAKRLATPEKD